MTATEELYDGLAETNYSGRLIAYVMEAMRTHSFDSKVLQDFIAEAETYVGVFLQSLKPEGE